MNKLQYRVSVVICVYTEARWNDLLAVVDSVRRQTARPYEVIVVVDHNPRLYERVCNDIRDVIVVENQEAQGLSGARNSGIAVATGDIVAFLDDDAVAAYDWLERLTQGYENHNVLGVGGAIEPMWQGGRPRWFPAEFDWVVGCTYVGMPTSTAATRNLIGCNMSFRREVFNTAGGFRSGIGRVGTRPVGCEETELCIRVRQGCADSILLYEPGAHVDHRVPENRATWRYFRSRCYAEGLSKALVTRWVGAGDGLASERTYTFRTLPRGIQRGIADTILRGDVTGLSRAAAIVSGLAITTTGYLVGTLAASLPVRSILSKRRRRKTVQRLV